MLGETPMRLRLPSPIGRELWSTVFHVPHAEGRGLVFHVDAQVGVGRKVSTPRWRRPATGATTNEVLPW